MPPRQTAGQSRPSAFYASVEGRVQGVGFRYTCLREGRRLGLTGWVRNTSGGDVEVWAEGAGEKLEALLKWLRRGPPGAIVRGFRYDYTAATGNYADFSIVG